MNKQDIEKGKELIKDFTEYMNKINDNFLEVKKTDSNTKILKHLLKHEGDLQLRHILNAFMGKEITLEYGAVFIEGMGEIGIPLNQDPSEYNSEVVKSIVKALELKHGISKR